MMSFKKGGHGLPSRQAISPLLLACLTLEKAKLSGFFLVQLKAKAVNNQWWAEMWQPRCGTTQGFSYIVFLFKDCFFDLTTHGFDFMSPQGGVIIIIIIIIVYDVIENA